MILGKYPIEVSHGESANTLSIEGHNFGVTKVCDLPFPNEEAPLGKILLSISTRIASQQPQSLKLRRWYQHPFCH